MGLFFLGTSIVLAFIGHVFKALRWEQFSGVYETLERKTLLRALVYGQVINFLVPFRIGDVVRAVYAGRRMTNGMAFSLATVILDRLLDVWVIGILFGISFAAQGLDAATRGTVLTYTLMAVGLVLLIVVSLRFRKGVKKLAKQVCSIFNERIELSLMEFLWSLITAVKDLVTRLDKKRLLLNTAGMWLAYLLSYLMLSRAFVSSGDSYGFFDVFALLYDSRQVNMSQFMLSRALSEGTVVIVAVYSLMPPAMLFLFSLMPSGIMRGVERIAGAPANTLSMLNLLPYVSAEDKLKFLEEYFEAENQEYLAAYIQMNRDVLILEDFSAGSNATTMLCMVEQKTIYRKYVFGKEADKLCEQISWLEEHAKDIPVPEILRKQIGSGYCCYDMPCYPTAIGLFQYLHSVTVQEGWSLLERALLDLQKTIHQQNVRPAEEQLIRQYVEKKVWENIRKIEQSRELEPLLNYDTLVINGRRCRGFAELKRRLAHEKLCWIFQQDEYATIHGDLTVENIICWRREQDTSYYFIDPGTGSIHESPLLDFAKLLQSLRRI